MGYQPDKNRYQTMQYRRCGQTGLKLPAISLGLWHNFGDTTLIENSRQLLQRAFDLGITHFDLANNYGPYGDWGSRKYLISSLDQSLKRMGLEYVDIFYHHRPDPETPLQETMKALDHVVRQGKALYVGLSNYPAELARKAIDILNDLGTPCVIHQPKYSMFERAPEAGLLDVLKEKGVGCIPFSPLAGGQLTNRYLHGIPQDSRAASGSQFLNPDQLTEEKRLKVVALNALAESRGQKLSQMALAWVLRHDAVTSVLIGASKTSQIDDAVGMLENRQFSAQELATIDDILNRSN